MKGTKNTSKKLLSLLLIGNSASGKTAIISSFDGEISKNHCQTIGNDFSFKKLVISDGNTKESIDVKNWDSAGTERYKEFTSKATKKAQGIMIIYEVIKRIVFDELDSWFEMVQLSQTKSIPVILVGNKIDLEEKREISTLEGQQMANKYSVPFFEVSAFNLLQVEQIFNSLIVWVYSIEYHKLITECKIESQEVFKQLKKTFNLYQEYPNNHFIYQVKKFRAKYRIKGVHNIELSTKELKNRITKLETENMDELYLSEIESYIEDMKPIKCDFNYQKYFSMLYKKIESMTNQVDKTNFYIKSIYIFLLCFLNQYIHL